MNRRNAMTSFLQKVYRNSANQPINDDIIYQFLMYETVREEDMEYMTYEGVNVKPLFKVWMSNFRHKINSHAYDDHDYFFLFEGKNVIKKDDFIKFYIPFDLDHLETGVNLLFDFLDKERIDNHSKVSRKMRADNVIIRIRRDDIQSRDKIINFINENPYFRNAFNKVNPFVPTIGNIGIMEEHGNSYNRDISILIVDYFKTARMLNKKDVNVDDFYEYLKYRSTHSENFDFSVLKTFEEAYNGINIITKKERYGFSREQKMAIFMDAVKNTYRNHGAKHLKKALLKIIADEDYSSISTKGCNFDLRQLLSDNVMSSEVSFFIDNYLIDKKIFNNKNTTKDKIELFVNSLFNQDLALIFDEICNLTLEKYGPHHLETAIKLFVFKGEIRYFSRFANNSNVNYRMVLGAFDRTQIYNIMIESLISKGVMIGYPNFDELIELYIHELVKSRYIDVNERPSITK